MIVQQSMSMLSITTEMYGAGSVPHRNCTMSMHNWETIYICYIDFQKAYDMVPHKALFVKLEAFGMTGMALEFIKVLYNRLLVQVWVGDNMTSHISILRGVRGGCLGSFSLFNVFINDILASDNMKGVDVLGLLE